MSLRVLTTQQASTHPSGQVNAQPLAECCQASDPRVWLAALNLPITTVLQYECCPTALWSEHRRQCAFNSAATALLGVCDSDLNSGKVFWLDCVDPLDSERFLSAWQSLQSGAGKMVCSYRFSPRAGAPTIELEETALRLAVGSAGESAVLSRFQLRQPRDSHGSSSMRSLIHQIGNSLQSVRGEVDLLRLSGALPQRSFDAIIQGIENIRELTARFDDPR